MPARKRGRSDAKDTTKPVARGDKRKRARLHSAAKAPSNADTVSSSSATSSTTTTTTGSVRAVHRFTPVYGALETSAATGVKPMCYLLEFDGVNILLDCGSSEQFDAKALEPLRAIAPTVHLVLISHASLEHVGAIPYAVAHLGLTAPIYSTLPVKRMGEMYLYDALIAREWGPGAKQVRAALNKEGIDKAPQLMTADDVDVAFEQFETLNFRQNLTVNTQGGTIVITPYPSGSTLGGAMWGITKETDRIVYANRFNHRKELHLPRCALNDPKLSKPSLLIVDAYNVGVSVPTRSSNDQQLFDQVIATLRGGGNILIPVDSGSRVLEICLAFDRYWASSKKRGAYNLALLSPLHKSMLGIAQQNMNYMNTELTNQFSKDRINPFQFRYVHQCASEEELNDIRGPKVVFATTNTLEYGCGHDLLEEWCSSSKNVIIMTERGSDNTLGSTLANEAIQRQLIGSTTVEEAGKGTKGSKKGKGKGKKKKQEEEETEEAAAAAAAAAAGASDAPSSTIVFTKRWKVDLEGNELDRWITSREIEREKKEYELLQLKEKEDAMNFKMDEQDEAQDGGGLDTSTTEQDSSTVVSSSSSSSSSSSGNSTNDHSSSAMTKAVTKYHFTPAFAMFGYKQRTAYFDDYGEQTPLTPYMDQFALRDATSIDLLVDHVDDGSAGGKGGGKGGNTGRRKNKWKDRRMGKKDVVEQEIEEEEEEEEEEDDGELVPQKILSEEIQLEMKCRYVQQ